MRNFKAVAVLMFLAAAVCMPTLSHAQTITDPQINGVGSSGTFTTVVIAMVSQDPTVYPGGNPVCGSRVWTYSGASHVNATDPRGSVPSEPGNIAVVWDNDTNPGIVCSYFSVDSIVGDRLLLAQSGSGGVAGNGTINLDTTVLTAPGQNKIAYVTDTATSGLPSLVRTILNGKHFNVAFSDIRPDDAQYAVQRASCTPFDGIRCFGYGPAPTGTAILSTWNTNNQANTVAFAVSGGTDPFPPNLTVPATTILDIGAYPVMMIYNNSDTSTASSLGTLAPKNVLSHVVSAFYGGRLQGSQDLTGASVPGVIVDVVQREPISGTYNTFEFQGVEDRDSDISISQEATVTPSLTTCGFVVPGTATYVSPARASTCQNPMNVPGPGNGGAGFNRKYRAIGTGEMIGAIDSTNGANRLGYAFFGLGSFGGKTHTRYMMVDGVDPLFTTPYTTNGDLSALCSGKINLGTFTCTNNPSFDQVVNGSYRLWNIIRAIYYSSYTAPLTGPSVPGLILAAQDQAHSASGPHDFAPSQYCAASSSPGTCSSAVALLPVFRIHYPIPGITVGVASNGNGGEPAANGGDMAGAILPVVSDVSYFNVTGNYFTDYIQ